MFVPTLILSHYADGDTGNLELRLVDVATGLPAAGFDWGIHGIVQVTPSPDGPPWFYRGTLDLAPLPASTYLLEWRRISPAAGPWTDDEFTWPAVVAEASDIDLFRLYLDDVEGLLFGDDAVAALLAAYGDVRLAVAGAANTLALRFAGGIKKFTTDGQTFERGSRSDFYAKLAASMRNAVAAETNGGVTTAYMTRIDGHSDDISAEDANAYGTLDGTGRVGWRFANVHGDEPIWLPE